MKRSIFLFLMLLAAAVPATAIELSSRPGTVHFDHDRHIASASGRCVVCHHTSTGTEVRDTCRQCHRPASPALPDSRAAFHASCIGCHERLHRSGQAAGPVKRCTGCHRPAAGQKGDSRRP